MTRREDVIGRPLFEVFPDNPTDPAATGVRNLRALTARRLQRETAALAEEQRARQRVETILDKLRESEERYRLLVDMIPKNVWTTDPDGRHTFARWRHSLKTGEPYEIEYRFSDRKGDYHWFLGKAMPLRNEAGEIVEDSALRPTFPSARGSSTKANNSSSGSARPANRSRPSSRASPTLSSLSIVSGD